MRALQTSVARVSIMVCVSFGSLGWSDEMSVQRPAQTLCEFKCRLKPEFHKTLFPKDLVMNKEGLRLLLQQWLAEDNIAVPAEEISLVHLSRASMTLVIRASDRARNGIQRVLEKRTRPRIPGGDEGIPIEPTL